jgi:maleate isomerase
VSAVYAPDPADGKWGALGRLGFIELSTSIALSAELPSALPPGVTALLTRLRLPDGEVSLHALERMVASWRLEEATRELVDGEVDVVAFACTTGSLIGGVGFDRKLIERMERAGGVRATTTSTALIAALEALEVRSVGLATPYIDELNEVEVSFLRASGFDVKAARGLSVRSDPEIARVPYERTRELAHTVARAAGDPDALFLSCTNLLTLALLDPLERELGMPVISSVAVTIWHGLVLAGVTPSAAGVGSLLRGRRGATPGADRLGLVAEGSHGDAR